MDALLNPDKFFSERVGMGFRTPIMVVIAFAIVSALSANFVSQTIAEELVKRYGKEMETVIAVMGALAFISAFLGSFLNWLIITAILYALSALAGGKGSFSALLKFTAFSFIPSIICSPVTSYLTIEAFKSMSLDAFLSLSIFSLALMLWQYVYWVFAVKNARNLSFGRAAAVSAVPVLVYAALSFYSLNMQIEGIKSLGMLRT